ncbi:MAG: helix-hairpin-helix domain-containing protein [Bacteroidaceae bacterium]|nr:helix-hairpin-helix domain-containing protein [Bacteroidaceae bacterium]
MKNRLLISWFAVLSISSTAVYPQNTGTDGWESVLETLLSDEDLSQDALEELAVLYESLHEMPLNINTATREELSALPFLSEKQIEDIHAYVFMHGPMLTLGELQLTGSLDFNTRQLLRHFVYAGEVPMKREKLRLDDILSSGRNEVTARMDIPLYTRDGFRYHSPEELARYPNRAYLGGRLSHNIRYSFSWHNRIRFGMTADKDAGERGYDFLSPYLYLRDMGLIKELVLGNFKAQLGHGLLLGGGFSVGKNMALSSMSRQTQGLKPHASNQEYGFFRGAGVAMGGPHTTFTLLAASTPLDAAIRGDTLISSFKEDGYHRTRLERSRKHNVMLRTVAANIRYGYRGLKVGVTGLAERLSLPYKGRDSFIGASVDCSLNRARYGFHAELSLSNGKPALMASQTFRLKRERSLSVVLRHYDPEYSVLHSNAMAEGGVQNETGLLMGFTKNTRKLKLDGYADFFVHPEPGYGASERSNGMDLRLEADWQIGRRDALFATARFKTRQKDCKYTRQLEYCLTGRYRLRWTHDCRFGARICTQLFYARYDFIAEPVSNGYALTGSYNRNLLKGKLDVSIAAAAFLTGSYDSRISVYESGLRYSYNFISLYGKGGHLAATVRYRITPDMQLNLKTGGTYYLDRDEISSAQQRIDSCHKEEISVQFIAKF